MIECLSLEELSNIWSNDVDYTILNDVYLTLYWNHCLWNDPLACLYWLATRSIQKNSILRVLKLPLYESYAFSTAHRYSYCTKFKANRRIRKLSHNTPYKRTSYNHVISQQPGLISSLPESSLTPSFGDQYYLLTTTRIISTITWSSVPQAKLRSKPNKNTNVLLHHMMSVWNHTTLTTYDSTITISNRTTSKRATPDYTVEYALITKIQ